MSCEIILCNNWFCFFGGTDLMKTKIIYISGSEVFNMADVRNAFETVRHELGLANDTILFGVPVDAEDALAGQFDNIQPVTIPEIHTAQEPESTLAHIETAPQEISEPDIEPVVKKEKRSKKVIAKKDEENTKPEDNEKVIPILSVLSGDDAPHVDIAPDKNISPMVDDIIDTVDEDIDLSDKPEKSDTIIDISDDFSTDNIAQQSDDFDLADVDIDIDIPSIETETTKVSESDSDEEDGLAKLLKSVQSLHEDELQKPELSVIENDTDETDATLEKLATEFAENQDKIVNTTKSGARGGRIGKLKNILPFKKAKNNESSLMGDLFGWAGVAANDEEFGLPEFFPSAAKK